MFRPNRAQQCSSEFQSRTLRNEVTFAYNTAILLQEQEPSQSVFYYCKSSVPVIVQFDKYLYW